MTDSVYSEASFILGRTQDYVAHSKGERASVVHHKDNLKMEGKMESRAVKAKAIAAERAAQVKHDDNLKLEGSMDGMKRRGTITLSSNKETVSATKHEDNLKMEGSFESRSQSTLKQKSQMDSAHSSMSNLSQATFTKSNQSVGISGAMHQTGKEEASITAISKDKFVSSLRESSGVAVGQQKEMSVIDHHRKQSLQKQQRENWDTRVTGYSVGEAHTGRTAAYGGRDYEYSSSIAAASRSGSAAVSRQSQSASWSAAEHSSSTSRITSSQQSRASISGQHQSSSSALMQSSSSMNAAQQSSSRASISAQHQSSSSMSASQQASSRASRQDFSGLSGFRQDQVAGYARNLGNSHSGSALIKSDQVIRHEASSSAYQSVAQQSYRGQQADSRVERTTPSRRRTWAESSLMHGGAAAIGQSIYAQDFHQHSCPASKVYTNTSPFKYERQSSSGHKMFKERGENR